MDGSYNRGKNNKQLNVLGGNTKIDIILNVSCLGSIPTSVWIPAGDITVILSSILTFK